MDLGHLLGCIEFEWDEGNHAKNWHKHQVSYVECEQLFFNEPLFIHSASKHSQKEDRHFALGRTDANRLLFAAFTIRQQRIRVISARDMSKKERAIYEENSKLQN